MGKDRDQGDWPMQGSGGGLVGLGRVTNWVGGGRDIPSPSDRASEGPLDSSVSLLPCS